MPLLSARERALARAVSSLARSNPFLPERIEAEREILGAEHVEAGAVWHARTDRRPEHPNISKIRQRAESLAAEAKGRLLSGVRAPASDLALYEDLALYILWERYEDDFYRLAVDPEAARGRVGFYTRFLQDLSHFLAVPGAAFPALREPAHLFAVFHQIRRAFHLIFRNLMGSSMPAARLRAAVWQSIFTHDLARYRRSLFTRMGDIPTLIVGPSGTGKELVAQAIGLARYMPFDPGTQRFAQAPGGGFFPLNLSALSPTLIESELFGHRRGAFTGAVQDRGGWLETCPALGTVFLDEIAEVDVSIQVKLLRVLETRSFQRLGETRERRFEGKIIAATNRDLGAEMRAGRFREDLYYRLCADLIETPPLAERLRDFPGELHDLLVFIARRVAGEPEAEGVAWQVEEWIAGHLGPDYPWPGNVRELEQCVRNVMIRGEYRPAGRVSPTRREELVEDFLGGSLSAEELLRSYCTLLYARTGSYLETARRLGLDRRTVRSKIDAALLDRLRKADRPQETGGRNGSALPRLRPRSQNAHPS
jgi:hypothetical protein